MKLKKQLQYWQMAIRPKTLPASILPVILGLVLALKEMPANQTFNLLNAILIILVAVLLQIASNLANDYLDAQSGVDTHSRLGPVRVTQAGLISGKAMRLALMINLFLALITGCYLMYIGGPIILGLGLISLYFSYGYSGGPMPLSRMGLGEISAFLFFGIIAVGGTFYIETQSYTFKVFLFSLIPASLSACLLAVNNLRDYYTDKEARKLTLAVRWGIDFQRKLTTLLFFFPSIVVAILVVLYGYYWAAPLVFTPLLFTKTWPKFLYGQIDRELNPQLFKVVLLLAIYTLTLSSIVLWEK